MPAHNADPAERVIAAAIAVHTALGPGLLESICERALAIDLQLAGVPHLKQVISYLRMASMKTGLLINFNVGSLVDGISVYQSDYSSSISVISMYSV